MLSIFAALVGLLFVYPHVVTTTTIATNGEPQQRRRTQQRGGTRRKQPQRARPRGINYSRFLHDNNHVKYDNAKRANCSDCHSLASPLQFDIKDYPDHPACVNCHRQQFFTGARPPICTVCHKVSSPRDDRRFDFPKPGTDITREFPGRFPHGLHQDLLAGVRPAPEREDAASLVRASFNRSVAQDTIRTRENCAVCHASYDKTKKTEEAFFPGANWPDNMLANVGTYKKIPDGPEGHRTCFVCHASDDNNWKSPSPVANDCAGCHSSRIAPGAQASAGLRLSPSGAPATARSSSVPMKVSFTSALLPPRKVLTFQHEGGGAGGSHEEGCTTCHINITQEQTFVVKPDVPITSCAICHVAGGKKSSLKKGTDTTITTEMDAWIAGKKACLSCHTAEIGNRPPPCSHYYADRRVPPPELQCR